MVCSMGALNVGTCAGTKALQVLPWQGSADGGSAAHMTGYGCHSALGQEQFPGSALLLSQG